MKYITFSQRFPSDHPRKGEPTYFVEQMITNLISLQLSAYGTELLKQQIVDISGLKWNRSKNHTIRSGKRWNVGEWFSPRIWTGKPYHSKMMAFAPPVQIKKIWNIQIQVNPINSNERISRKQDDKCYEITISGETLSDSWIDTLADNDGLFPMDFLYWFSSKSKEPFIGQILCWDENVIYPGDSDYNPDHYYQ